MAVQTVVFIYLSCLFMIVSGYNTLNNVLFDGDFVFVDLTHPFDNKTVYWPNTQKFEFTKIIADVQGDGSWYAVNEFAAGEHGGTHMDAPYHFKSTGQLVGEMPLERLIVPLLVIDISNQVDKPQFVLYKQHLTSLLPSTMDKPCMLLFKFGWSKYFDNRDYYLGWDESTQTLSFPGLSAEVAELITSYKNVVGVAVDVASVDPGSSTDFPVHKILANAGIYNIENVNIKRTLPAYGCTAIALPMKIAQGTGAPMRLVAICPKDVAVSNK